ncbi:hypothetical protein CAC42_1012 [Sphaceloma murrayae]|uniref:Uncharacterized protein n=1 Tax=Sphaceloma murrayae TaxID=2082308 RepID=A0A2K1R221_9PEZI|nr:hypothetical protein CAC42_1012 [Sphaceloma murrayae]
MAQNQNPEGHRKAEKTRKWRARKAERARSRQAETSARVWQKERLQEEKEMAPVNALIEAMMNDHPEIVGKIADFLEAFSFHHATADGFDTSCRFTCERCREVLEQKCVELMES